MIVSMPKEEEVHSSILRSIHSSTQALVDRNNKTLEKEPKRVMKEQKMPQVYQFDSVDRSICT
jgi:hypothetical protein